MFELAIYSKRTIKLHGKNQKQKNNNYCYIIAAVQPATTNKVDRIKINNENIEYSKKKTHEAVGITECREEMIKNKMK